MWLSVQLTYRNGTRSYGIPRVLDVLEGNERKVEHDQVLMKNA